MATPPCLVLRDDFIINVRIPDHLASGPVPRLIIVDIRKNGGGDDSDDLLTFSHIAGKPFQENRFAYTLFQRVPLPAYAVTDEPNNVTDLEISLRVEHN